MSFVTVILLDTRFLMKKIAILQSNYIPWKGYFDLIASVDEFILFDDMQYSKGDWRNRNKIKTPNGAQWLTVPVKKKGKFGQKIKDVEIEPSDWQEQHWRSVVQNYKKARCFDEIALWLEPLYREIKYGNLSALNRVFIEAICDYLDIKTTISNSWDYHLIDGKTERLASLCEQAGGTEYVSGPSAKNYIIEDVFTASNIKLSWIDYSGYPEYQQLHGDFIHEVTILDLLFNHGKESKLKMRISS
jgi:hypothetical protein